MKELESDIEDILEAYPDLVDEKFIRKDYNIERQCPLGKNRIDLLISNTEEWNIIEIKKTPLADKDYIQIHRYRSYARNLHKNLTVWGYLIGYSSKSPIKIDRRSFRWLKVLYLDIDLPSQIRICQSCRKPIPKFSYECKYCFSRI